MPPALPTGPVNAPSPPHTPHSSPPARWGREETLRGRAPRVAPSRVEQPRGAAGRARSARRGRQTTAASPGEAREDREEHPRCPYPKKPAPSPSIHHPLPSVPAAPRRAPRPRLLPGAYILRPGPGPGPVPVPGGFPGGPPAAFSGTVGHGSARAGAPRVGAGRAAACEWRRPRSAAPSGAATRRGDGFSPGGRAGGGGGAKWLRCGFAAASRRPETPPHTKLPPRPPGFGEAGGRRWRSRGKPRCHAWGPGGGCRPRGIPQIVGIPPGAWASPPDCKHCPQPMSIPPAHGHPPSPCTSPQLVGISPVP